MSYNVQTTYWTLESNFELISARMSYTGVEFFTLEVRGYFEVQNMQSDRENLGASLRLTGPIGASHFMNVPPYGY
jgi:hypothetical protein